MICRKYQNKNLNALVKSTLVATKILAAVETKNICKKY